MPGMTQWPEADSVRVRWLVLIVAVMVGLTAGWPLLNTAVANRQPIPAGTQFIGGGPANSARVTVGPGWTMAPAQSNPHVAVSMNRGPVSLYAAYVRLPAGWHAGRLWTGLRNTLRIRRPGARLGAAEFTTTEQGLTGLVGTLMQGNLLGTATIFPAPSGRFAVVMLLLAPRHTRLVDLAVAHKMIRSMRFTGTGRDRRR
jgi:hypothetical protein